MRNGKRRKTYGLIFLAVMLMFLPGCWDSHELNKLSIIAGLGFDIDPETGENKITYQSIIPNQVKNPSGGGEGAHAIKVVQNTGSTPYDTLSRAMQHSSHNLFYPHAQIYIFGKESALQGIYPFIDGIARNVQSRPNVLVAIADKEAADILGAQDEDENIQAIGLTNYIKLSARFSNYQAVTFLEFCNRLMSKSTAPIAPVLGVFEEIGPDGKKMKKARITGMGVFKDDKIIGELNEMESRGLLWVIDRIKSGYIIVPDASLQILTAKSKIIPELEDGKIQIRVEIEVQSKLAQYMGKQDLTPSILKELEKRQSEKIKKEIMAAVQKSFFLHADIFGFGEAVHRSYKKEWQELEPGWEDYYSEIKVVVKVKTHINEVGDISKAVIKH